MVLASMFTTSTLHELSGAPNSKVSVQIVAICGPALEHTKMAAALLPKTDLVCSNTFSSFTSTLSQNVTSPVCNLADILETALSDDTVSIIDCPVDYRENIKLTEQMGNLVCPT